MTIIVHRNRILANGFIEDESLEKFIKKNTVYQRKMTFGYDELWTGVKNVMFEGEKYFALPRNFPPSILRKYLEPEEREAVSQPEFVIPHKQVSIALNEGAVPRNDLQKDILDFLHGRAKYAAIAKKPRRALFADTDSGKTFTTISYVCETGLMPLIVCPDDRAIATWVEEFTKFTNITKDQIAIVKGRDRIDFTLKRKDQYKLVLLSGGTASAIFKAKDDAVLVDFFEQMQIGLKVYDELHMHLETTFNMEMTLVTHRTFYLTATNVKRLFGEQTILDNMTPPEDCVFQPPPVQKFEFTEIQYFTNPAEADQRGINKPGGFDALVYLNMLFNPKLPYRQMVLSKVIKPTMRYALKNISDSTNKIAILTKTNETGIAIGEYIAKEFPGLTIGYYNSKIAKMEDRVLEFEKDVIISTDKSFSGIINIPRLEVVINMTPITSEAHIKQIAGRLRKEPDKRRIFIQLVDFSFKKARNMMYRERVTMEPICTEMERVVVGKSSKAIEEEEE